MTVLRAVSIMFGMMWMMVSPVWAQSHVQGTVQDAQALAMPGVTVTLTPDGSTRTITDEAGRYTLPVPASGDYQVSFTLDGFATVIRAITVTATPLDLSVTLTPGGLAETVTVSGRTATLASRTLGTSLTLDPTDLATIPANGRNLTSLILLTPGATTDGNGGWSSLRIQGKSNQQNYLTIDGIDGTFVWDATPGYLTATGSQFRLQQSLEAIDVVDVAAGVTAADKGLGTGSAITLVTKRGGQAWEGSWILLGRPASWGAASPYDDQDYPLSLLQTGGSLGGPLVAGRFFAFASLEGLTQDTRLSFTEAVPSEAARQAILTGTPRQHAVAPLLAGFPAGTSPTANPLLDLATATSTATQREIISTSRLDYTPGANHRVVGRLSVGAGELDTPDRTVTPRRILATESLVNGLVSYQGVRGRLAVDVTVGLNRPHTEATAFAPAGYEATGVSLSGTVTSGSIDARGTTGIARSGLLIRASSASSTTGSSFQPQSWSVQPAVTYQRGNHTLKIGGEYRQIEGTFQFLGSTEVVYNSIEDFIANRPNLIARAETSPWFHPQQWYGIGYVHDTWRVTDALTWDLGLRYDYYSVVRERDGLAAPFIVEENAFTTPDRFHAPDTNNWAPRLAATYQFTPTLLLRTGYGWTYGPGQFEDRIQPIENMIVRQRVTPGDVPGLAYPVSDAQYRQVLSVRGTTWQRPDERSIQYSALLTKEWRGAWSTTVGYIGSQGRDLFLRGVANTLDPVTRRRDVPEYGQVDYKTSGCVTGVIINGNAITGCGRSSYDALSVTVTRRMGKAISALVSYQYARNRGTTQGSNEAATAQNTFDYDAESGTNPQDFPHSLNASVVTTVKGWQIANLFTARSGTPINVTINRPDNLTINGVTVANIPGGNTRGTQRPDLVPGVNPYLRDGVRWLNPAAFTTPQPGTFGNAPRNGFRGPAFWQWDMAVSRRLGSWDVRLDVFNVTNHLNYEAPTANLPNGVPGQPFTEATAGTFGYMLGPLNRSLGLGTARQAQVSVRWWF